MEEVQARLVVRRIGLKDFPITVEQPVVWRGLDALGHVNNAVYATYLENGRMAYISHFRQAGGDFYQLILAEVTITFKSPAFLPETLVIGTRVASISQFRHGSPH